MQDPGLDVRETYAATCKPETMKTLFALAAQWGLQVRQDGRQNGLLKFTLDRDGLHGATGRVHRGQGQSVFTLTQF